MASTTVMKVKVQELTKFGFKANDKYVGYSPKMPEKDKALVVPGRTLEVEMYVADSGKEYVNKVLSEKGVMGTTVFRPSEQHTKNVTLPKNIFDQTTEVIDKPMTRTDWDAKDVRISRQGAIQAAYRVAAQISPETKLKATAFRIADEMIEYVKGK